MNRQLCRGILLLLLGILIVCLPAQAAQAGQSGPSSPISDQGARANVSSGLSAVNTPQNEGNLPGINSDNNVQSPSSVLSGPELMTSRTPRDTTGKSTQPGPVNTVKSNSPGTVPSGDSSDRSDFRKSGSADAGPSTGSPREAGGENVRRSPQTTEQAAGSGRLAGMMLSLSSMGAARSSPVNENGGAPARGNNPGSPPQRQQHAPPAQSGNYPCGPAQATPLPPATAQTRDESKDDTPQRQRAKRPGLLSLLPEPVAPGPESSSSPLHSLFPLNMLLIGGYRRISKKNVLEHDARQTIYQTITETPGIDTKVLTDMTGINENTLRYHLDRLTATGKISCFTRPGVVRYFQNQGAYSQYEHTLFHYLWTETPRRILGMLYQHPGLTRQEIADALAITGPSVTRQMDNLIEDGVVENRFPGRSNHYYLIAEAAQILDRLTTSTPGMMQTQSKERSLSATAG
jgi:predicted ArsR family transcriptional regulator